MRRGNTTDLNSFPLDLSYRVTATWLPSDGKQTVDVPNVLGDVSPTPIAGTAVFKINGQELRLTDLGGDAAKGLFFVFSDPTSKTDTYPGGRFLKTGPVTNGTVVLDFNRAYNPPCAVTPYATCPLAPKENRLSVAIPGGRRVRPQTRPSLASRPRTAMVESSLPSALFLVRPFFPRPKVPAVK